MRETFEVLQTSKVSRALVPQSALPLGDCRARVCMLHSPRNLLHPACTKLLSVPLRLSSIRKQNVITR